MDELKECSHCAGDRNVVCDACGTYGLFGRRADFVMTTEEQCPCCAGDRDIVCDACGTHACWAGNFMCEDAHSAGTRQA